MPNQQENKIKVTAVAELLGMNFFIPGYQRGYRWTEQQVNDLLNDINEFEPENDSWYCLQPLVVKRLKEDTFKRIKEEAASLDEVKSLLKGRWEVIDGQQRLTTIYLLLAYLEKDTKKAESAEQKKTYSIEYETREDSKEFLEKISEKNEAEAQSNIDFFYMHKAYKTINNFFEEKKNQEDFKNKLLNNVKFIWYEIDEGENPVTVFTRLNMGKIPLTNAELIKALFLNRSNFGAGEEKNETLRLRQQEIASEWDNIEYTLQNDEFWLFLNQPGDKRPTRIDFIFDLICEQKALDPEDEKDLKKDIGTDEYRTFRYFYNYFKTENADVGFCWKTVKKYFQIFQEWYNDLELYHYVGYLIIYGKKINTDNNSKKNNILDYLIEWDNKADKKLFLDYTKEMVKRIIGKCPDLDFQYKEDGSNKRDCKPILLLHNIQTIINQYNAIKSNDKYQIGVFYKFPFHLFKLESWDVEHINSNTTNPVIDEEMQKEWLVNIYLSADGKLQDKIKDFFSSKNENDDLFNRELKQFSPKEEWSPEEKNRIWNYTLLDSSTNRSYGNAIFSSKRRIIIGKDRGKWIPIPRLNKDGQLVISEEKDAPSAFVPPVTKHIFLKYYSSTVGDNNYWTKEDAESYKKNILDTLKEFGVTDSRSENNENNK